jgi:hypothetical protein
LPFLHLVSLLLGSLLLVALLLGFLLFPFLLLVSHFVRFVCEASFNQ